MGDLGERLRELRQKREYTVREFADLIGKKSPGYISRIETRGEIPSSELLCVIADVLGVDVRELLELAKKGQLQRMEREIESKQESALSLYRKAKK